MLDKLDVLISRRCIVVLAIIICPLDITINNKKIFQEALLSDSQQSILRGFYWFNVIDGESNPLYPILHGHHRYPVTI